MSSRGPTPRSLPPRRRSQGRGIYSTSAGAWGAAASRIQTRFSTTRAAAVLCGFRDGPRLSAVRSLGPAQYGAAHGHARSGLGMTSWLATLIPSRARARREGRGELAGDGRRQAVLGDPGGARVVGAAHGVDQAGAVGQPLGIVREAQPELRGEEQLARDLALVLRREVERDLAGVEVHAAAD